MNNRTEQIRENNAETIAWILGATGEAKKNIKGYILEQGIKAFCYIISLWCLPRKNMRKLEY